LHFFRKHPDKEVSAFPNVEEEKQEEPIGKPNENADHFPTVLLSETEETPHYLKYEGRDSYLDFILPEGDFIIGKNADCVEGYIKNEKVSRMHALIRKKDNAFFLQDLNSTNGTYLNHELLNVQELRQLHDGDEILFANVPYRFCEH
jgi:pSer/pThr/pTyr-binding forkhead associated (FHA) protein